MLPVSRRRAILETIIADPATSVADLLRAEQLLSELDARAASEVDPLTAELRSMTPEELDRELAALGQPLKTEVWDWSAEEWEPHHPAIACMIRERAAELAAEARAAASAARREARELRKALQEAEARLRAGSPAGSSKAPSDPPSRPERPLKLVEPPPGIDPSAGWLGRRAGRRKPGSLLREGDPGRVG